MKKFLKLITLLGVTLFGVLTYSQSPIPITGNVQSVTGTNCTGGTGGTSCFIRVTLRNYSGNIPRVIGTGMIIPTQPADILPDNTGAWTTNLWGNDQIQPLSCGTGGTLPCTFYTFEFWYGGQMKSSGNWQFTGTNPINLNTAAPMTTGPPPKLPYLPVLINPIGPQQIQLFGLGAQSFEAEQFVDFNTNGSVTFPATGFCRIYFNGTNMAGVNSVGGNCNPTGGGSGSGTVNPGTINCSVYYPASTAAVSPQCALTWSGLSALFSSSVSSSSDGVHPGILSLFGNTTAPSISANTINLIGPNVASFAGYGLQFPATPPTNGQNLAFGTCASGVCPITYTNSTASNTVVVTPDFNFTACVSGCLSVSSPSTITVGANTITLTPVPKGVYGDGAFGPNAPPHYLQISATGTPTEYVLITGGTAVGGAASGTITFNSFYAHSSSAYTIASATSGIQEADIYATNLPSALAVPGVKLQLQAGGNYTCYAPIYVYNFGGGMEFDGQWATLQHASFNQCVVLDSVQQINFHDLTFMPTQGYWSVQPSLPTTTPGNSVNATFTIPTCPSGFYPFPGQMLWLAGTYNGSPVHNTTTQFYTGQNGYGEYVLTTGGTCTPGLANGTIIVTQANSWGGGIAQHGTGYSLSSGVGNYLEDNTTRNTHIHDLRWHSNGSSNSAGNLIQVNNDQSCAIDNLNMDAGFLTRKDLDFQSAGIYAPGNFNTNAAICYVGPSVYISEPSSCVKWFSGNDFSWTEGICQNYTAGGVVIGQPYGGFGQVTLGPNVHFETGSTPAAWGTPLGDPALMLVSAFNKPVVNYSPLPGGNFGTSNSSPWPVFANLASQTKTQYYYLVGHNNISSGCTSGGDCISAPIPIGAAVTTDPSANNVTVNWYGWGTNNYGPQSYDLLAVTANTATLNTSFPAAPSGTGLYAVATGLLPSAICNIHNVCSVVDNIAPASRASYVTNYLQGNAKPYLPDSFLMPGSVAIGGELAGGAALVAIQYVGAPTCVNSVQYLGAIYAAEFTRHSFGSELDIGGACPPILAPIASKGIAKQCFSSSGTCGFTNSGAVSIAPAATTVTVATTFVTMTSKFKIIENSTRATLLGVTCDTTAGRTYSITTVTPGTSFVITASAPPTNSACIDFEISN